MQTYSQEIKRVKPKPIELESMQELIFTLKRENISDIPALIKRLTLNIGYETSKQLEVLSHFGYTTTFAELDLKVQSILTKYYTDLGRTMYQY